MEGTGERRVVEFAFDFVLEEDDNEGEIADRLAKILNTYGYKVDYYDWRTVGKIVNERFIHVQ